MKILFKSLLLGWCLLALISCNQKSSQSKDDTTRSTGDSAINAHITLQPGAVTDTVVAINAIKMIKAYENTEGQDGTLLNGAIRNSSGTLFLGTFLDRKDLERILKDPQIIGIELRLGRISSTDTSRNYTIYYYGITTRNYQQLGTAIKGPVKPDVNPPTLAPVKY